MNRTVTPLPSHPRLSPNAGARDAAHRFEDSSSLECAASALEDARASLALHIKGVSDNKALELFEDMLIRLEMTASKMRVRASDIGDGL